MRFPVMVALLAAFGATPAMAASGTFEVPRLPGSTLPGETIPQLAGPRPAGDAIAFAAGSDARGWSVLLGAPGIAARRLAAYPPRALGPGLAREFTSLELQASSTRLAVVRHAHICLSCHDMQTRATLDALIAGPLEGPLTPIAYCETGQACGASLCSGDGPRFVSALGGDLLAVVDSCSQTDPAGLTAAVQTSSVIELATGAGRELGRASAAAVAGPFVAMVEPRPRTDAPLEPRARGDWRGLIGQSTVVVRDGASGAEVYRVGLPRTELPFRGSSVALLADGTVVFTSGVLDAQAGLLADRLAVITASPADPAGRVLRVVKRSTGIGGVAPGVVLLTSQESPLEFVSLDGGPVPAVSRFLTDLVGRPAFDGRTIAWAQRTCVTTVVTRWQIGDPLPAAPDLRCPTPRPSRSAAILPRDRRLRVALTCPATARGGCLAGVGLTAERRGRVRRGNGATRSRRLGGTSLALDPGERGLAEVTVPFRAARWVRKHPLRLFIDVAGQSPPALPPGDRGGATRVVTLRAER